MTLDSSAPYEFDNNFPLRSGVLLISEIGILSLVSVFGLLVVTSIRVFKLYTRHRVFDTGEPLLQPVSIFFIAAIIMDGVQAIGSVLTIRWAFRGAVTKGPYCTTQGVFKQLGNTGVALFTIAISVATYVRVVRQVPLTASKSNKIVASVIAVILLFQFLIILIPATTLPTYYDNTGLWCWVNGRSGETDRLRIASEYVFFWIAAFVSIVLYGAIVRRYLREASEGQRKIKDAVIMGWYPVAYVICVLPISVIRFISFDHGLDHGYAVLGGVFFAASGFINVLLWIITGRRFGFSKNALSGAEKERAIGQGDGAIPLAAHQAIPSSTSDASRSPDAFEPTAIYDPYTQPFDPYQNTDESYQSRAAARKEGYGTSP